MSLRERYGVKPVAKASADKSRWPGSSATVWQDAQPRSWWGEGYIGVCRKPWQFSCWNLRDPNYPYVSGARPIPPGATGASPDSSRTGGGRPGGRPHRRRHPLPRHAPLPTASLDKGRYPHRGAGWPCLLQERGLSLPAVSTKPGQYYRPCNSVSPRCAMAICRSCRIFLISLRN